MSRVSLHLRRRLAEETRSTRSFGDRWLITVRKGEGFSIGPWSNAGTAHRTWPSTESAFLLYGLLDVVIDGYFDRLVFDEYYEDVAKASFPITRSSPTNEALVPMPPVAHQVAPPGSPAA